jgi:hypothetical protein
MAIDRLRHRIQSNLGMAMQHLTKMMKIHLSEKRIDSTSIFAVLVNCCADPQQWSALAGLRLFAELKKTRGL